MSNFDKRLKYERFMNTNNIMTVDLHNNYTIIAIIGKDENNAYDVQLMLKENTVDMWDLIDKAEHLKFTASEGTIHSAVLKTISDYLHDGFFNYYINRYKYEIECFGIGIEVLENKGMNNSDAL